MEGRLAVECDGDKWHGPERYEHDMARQRDLERAGWQFVRIRGGDFYRDPGKAMEPVWLELNRLGIQPGGIDRDAAKPPPPANLEALTNDGLPAEPQMNEPPSSVGNPEPAAASENIVVREVPLSVLPDSESSAEMPKEGLQQSDKLPDPKLEQFVATASTTSVSRARALYISFAGASGPDPRIGNQMVAVEEVLCEIVKVEGPMFDKRAYDIYLRACGIGRMGG
jgi:hypothetical protein